MSTLRAAYVGTGCLGQSDVLLGRGVQEHQVSQARKHDVRTQDPSCGDGRLPVSGPFLVQCDDCGEEHSYEPTEVLRLELEIPTGFVTHPRFL